MEKTVKLTLKKSAKQKRKGKLLLQAIKPITGAIITKSNRGADISPEVIDSSRERVLPLTLSTLLH
jgi:hypothetical protein